MANTQDFINKHKNIAINEAVRTGIPASITLAQAILESGWGGSGLTVKANNYFGIKADSSWKGPVYSGATHEYYDGNRVDIIDGFRRYGTPRESFKDHSDFLIDMPRYDGLWNFPMTDYKNWAKGLQSAGYATSPTYANKLINLIEKYNLHQYDKAAQKRRFWFRVGVVVMIAVLSYAGYQVIKNL